MSSTATPKNLVTAVLLLGTAGLVYPSGASAGLGTCLRDWFARAGGVSNQLTALAPAEAALWQRVLVGEIADGRRVDPVFPYISILRLSDEEDLFWFAYFKLPMEIRQRLSAAPLDHDKALRFFAELRENVVRESSFLDLVQRRWTDQFIRAKVESYAHWERHGLDLLKTSQAGDPSFPAKLEARWQHVVHLENAGKFWLSAGIQPLPIRETARGYQITIGERSLPVQRNRHGWVAEVPRELLAHRFDNPVSTEKVIGMANGGVKPPSVYNVDIGLDGKLYITDGNHRFQLDSRKTIKVRIPDPPHTVSLPVMLSFLGYPQPAREAVLMYREGKITLEALLENDEKLLRRLTLLPATSN